MAKQVINVGSSANDGTGDKIRVAFQKTNANFTELYDGKIDSVVAGTNVTVDNTDPLNPIVSATGGGGGSQTLAQTLVLGNETDGEDIQISDGDGVFMDNGSRLIKGVTDAGRGGAKGIALKCSIDYEYKWEAGTLYVLEQDGFTVRETKYNFAITPTATDDSTKGFVVGSRWILDNGDIYICKDATSTAAFWELQIISGGGNGSLTYYLNGSVSQGTIGGNAYKEMNRVPVFGTGTDFTISANGYIAQFLTDVADPNRLIIPAGNWNFETYFSANSNGGTPRFYIELYKYDGATLTLLASNSATPEYITGGTSIDLYLTALAVPYTVLLSTDRLAVRFYVINSSKTITMHTENSDLSEVITTFTTGVDSVNGKTGVVVLTTDDIADSVNKRYQTDAQETVNDATSSIQTQLNGKQATLTAVNFGSFLNALANKTTPVSNDTFSIRNNVNGEAEEVTYTNLSATLKAYFDTIYAGSANTFKRILNSTVETTPVTGTLTETLLYSAPVIAGGTYAFDDYFNFQMTFRKNGITETACTYRVKVSNTNNFATASLLATWQSQRFNTVIERKNLFFKANGTLNSGILTTAVSQTDLTNVTNAVTSLSVTPANDIYLFISVQLTTTTEDVRMTAIRLTN